jgi:hypothetical protein
MRIGEPGYSLKNMEVVDPLERDAAGGSSILAYQRWLESRDQEQLNAIADDNADDCRSTRALRDRLLDKRRAPSAHSNRARRPQRQASATTPSWAPVKAPFAVTSSGCASAVIARALMARAGARGGSWLLVAGDGPSPKASMVMVVTRPRRVALLAAGGDKPYRDRPTGQRPFELGMGREGVQRDGAGDERGQRRGDRVRQQ